MESDGSTTNGFETGGGALKARLTPWREVVLLTQQLLFWEKPFYPAIIAAATTFVYLVLYCMDVSNLTLSSLLVAFVLIAEAAVPFIAPKVFDQSKWGATEEGRFHDACETIDKLIKQLTSFWTWVCSAKERSPVLFLTCAVGLSFVLAWLGSVLNGFFVAWIITLCILLTPGLKKNGVVEKAVQIVKNKAKKN